MKVHAAAENLKKSEMKTQDQNSCQSATSAAALWNLQPAPVSYCPVKFPVTTKDNTIQLYKSTTVSIDHIYCKCNKLNPSVMFSKFFAFY